MMGEMKCDWGVHTRTHTQYNYINSVFSMYKHGIDIRNVKTNFVEIEFEISPELVMLRLKQYILIQLYIATYVTYVYLSIDIVPIEYVD